MSTQFSDLNLRPELLQAVEELGYTEPTPIQEAVIAKLLDGNDIIGQAQTGTGKTAAFALPILHTITPGKKLPQALILAPTRELAMQVSKAVYDYGRHRKAQVLTIYGGAPYGRQINRLRKGVDIVVGTPGRLLDLMKRGALDLSQIKTLVLDEADEMLSMGFIEDIETILEATPDDRQMALFSATMPAPIRRLADKYMRQPEFISIKHKQLTVAAIAQRYYMIRQSDKMAALTRLLEVEEMDSVLIFARTRVSTGELANELTSRGFPAEVLNGDLSQDARERVMRRYRNKQIKALVATDVAARGLDVDSISHVFNYDLPQDPELYVHRIGRTGRAGKTGIAISLITPKELWRLRRIEKYTRQKISKIELPTIEEIQKRREDALLQKMSVWLIRGRCSRERAMVEQMVEEGFDVMDVAASALKLARAEEKQRPIPPIGKAHEPSSRDGRHAPRGRNDRRRGQRDGKRYGKDNRKGNIKRGGGARNFSRKSHENGMVRLTLSAGKEQGVRPNDVVGTIAFHADIPGRSLGAIHIHPQETHVDVPEQYVQKILQKSGSYQIHRQNIAVERA